MRAFYGTRISAHLSKTPEGFLICSGVPICRTGTQQYRGGEIGLDSDAPVDVYRPPSEVLSARTIASAEGKVVTDEHPGAFVNPNNVTAYHRGHLQNVRRGERLPDGEWPLVADLVIMDGNLISKVESGAFRDVSCGYDCTYVLDGDGNFEQRDIRINHLAVVPTGRAGANVRIMDAHRGELSFVEMAKRFHRRNPVEVAAERGIPTQDGLAEEMERSGRPRSWDEITRELRRVGEEEETIVNKGKTRDDLDARFTRVLDEVEELLAAYKEPTEYEGSELIEETNGVEMDATAADHALSALRAIRPVIERSGDRQAKDAYNQAIRILKHRAKRTPVADRVGPRVSVADLRQQQLAESFEETARQYHRRPISVHGRPEAAEPQPAGRTKDAPEDWADAMNAAGRKMRKGK